jgi:nucleoside-diphosphate-sugar epimerase
METLQIRRAIVAGATGAIGMALVKELTEAGVEVLALCRKNSARADRLNGLKGVEVKTCALEELASLTNDLQKQYDAFFHLAWAGTTGESRNDADLQCSNIRYALDAVQAAKLFGCKVFVGAGSQAEYGRSQDKLTSTTPTFPENGYGMAKLCAGQLTRLSAKKLEIRHVWARILSVYGPYDGENSMITSAIRTWLRGETPSFTAGEQIWDYLYSEDAARALILMAKQGRDGGVYPLGSGEAKPLKEYILALRDAVDKQAKAALGARPYSPAQVNYLCADISALKEDVGWQPTISFEEGAKKTVEWAKGEAVRK